MTNGVTYAMVTRMKRPAPSKYQHELQIGIERGIHKAAISYPRIVWPREADLTADAWVKIMANFDEAKCHYTCSAVSYAETVAYRMCLDVIRVALGRVKADRKIAPMLSGLDEHERNERDARNEMASRLKVAMASLTPAQRKALLSDRSLDNKGRVAKFRAITRVCETLGLPRPTNSKMARNRNASR